MSAPFVRDQAVRGVSRLPGPAARACRRPAWLLLALLWSTAAAAQEADLAITKSDGSDVYTPGSEVVYQVVVTNHGPDTVEEATVIDPLPAGILLGSWNCTATGGGSCDQGIGTGGINTAVDLPAGAQATFVHTISVPASFSGPLVNRATVSLRTGTDDPVPANNIATDTNRAFEAPTVRLEKISQGGTGSFDYAMTNLLYAADSITTNVSGMPTLSTQVATVTDMAMVVTVTETANPAFVLDDASCRDENAVTTGNPAAFGSLAGNVLTVDPDNLRSGAGIVCTFTNLLGADVSVDTSALPAEVRTGGLVSYTLTVANAGPADVDGVVLGDTPGAGLDCATPGTPAGCTASGGATCPPSIPVADLTGTGVTIPELPAGGQVQVTLQCTVTASGQ